jgi:CubicO group peptidase (beta-lactamase class C family)
VSNRIQLKRRFCLALALLLLAACKSATAQKTPTTTPVPPTHIPSPVPAPVSAAYWPTEGWRTSTPEEKGMDSSMLADMMARIQKWENAIDSVTIIRNGYLVLDATVHPFAPDTKHKIHSCTKSVTSALVGIAIDKGYIQNVGQPVLGFFPERVVAHRSAQKEDAGAFAVHVDGMEMQGFGAIRLAGFETDNENL